MTYLLSESRYIAADSSLTAPNVSALRPFRNAPVGEPYFLPVTSISGRQKRETLTARNTTRKSRRERAEVRLERASVEKEKLGGSGTG